MVAAEESIDVWPTERIRSLFEALKLYDAPESRLKEQDWNGMGFVKSLVLIGKIGQGDQRR